MKKLLLPTSILIDIMSICIMTMYLFKAKSSLETVYTVIYILFFVVHIVDKLRKEKLKKGLEKYKLSKSSYIYYMALISTFLLNIFLIVLAYNDNYSTDNLILLVIFYFI